MGNGGLKNAEKSVIPLTTHMVLYPAPAGIHVAGSNFRSRSLVWLKALWKGYIGYSAGKLWLSEKLSQTLGAWAGRVVPRFCLSRSAIELRVTLT